MYISKNYLLGAGDILKEFNKLENRYPGDEDPALAGEWATLAGFSVWLGGAATEGKGMLSNSTRISLPQLGQAAASW